MALRRTAGRDEFRDRFILSEACVAFQKKVETRVDESGEPIVITAEVADALELVENPSELVGAIFTDPAKALMAIGNIGADMSDTERQESQTVVVASVIVGAIASLSIRRM